MADDILKRCTLCGETKPGAQFSPRKTHRDGLHSWCKACCAERAREWAEKNKDRVSERNKARYWADPEAARASRTASYRKRTGGGPAKPAQVPEEDEGGVLTLWCRGCETRRPLPDFYTPKQGKHYGPCRACAVKKMDAYVATHREQVSEYKKRWAKEPGVVAARRARYAASPDSVKAIRATKAIDWSKKNPEKRAAIAQNYKHRRRALEDGGISSADLMEWKRAQPKVCYWCGKKCAKNSTVDHYVALSKGGKHEASNLVIACRPCNVKKNAKDPEQFRAETWHGTLFSNLITT